MAGDDAVHVGWKYRTTWMRLHEEGDQQKLDGVLDQWAEAGWEIVSATPLWVSVVFTGSMLGATESKGSVRWYVMWRKPFEG